MNVRNGALGLPQKMIGLKLGMLQVIGRWVKGTLQRVLIHTNYIGQEMIRV